MRPFNLQEALAGKPVVTRDGCKVTELHLFKDAIPAEQLVVVANGAMYQLFANGRYYKNELDAACDLFMAEEPREIWLNVYPATHLYSFGAHPDRTLADAAAFGREREAVIKVTLLDGKATAEVIEP